MFTGHNVFFLVVVAELLKSPFEASILKRAIDAKLVDVYVHRNHISTPLDKGIAFC